MAKILLLLLVCLIYLTMPLIVAQEQAGPWIIQVPTLNQESAVKLITAANDKAMSLESDFYAPAKCKMHIYVLGREGTILAATQNLGAWPGSADIAYRKARTAWLFKSPSKLLGELSRLDKPAKGIVYGIELSNGGLISFPGGLPIFDKHGLLVGTIGVSGDSVDNDELVAQAGVDRFKELGPEAVQYLPTLSQQGAVAIVHAAAAKACQTKSDIFGAMTKMHIYVLGREGTVLAATQADDAFPGSADIAYRKARTSWLFKLPTGTLGEFSRADKPAKAPVYGIELSNGGLITFHGGLPMFDANGELVGTIGVSGDSADKDGLVAQAGVDAFKAKQK